MMVARAGSPGVLDCSSPASALVSIAAVLGRSPENVRAACRSVNPEDRTSGDLLAALELPALPDNFEALYFHGSRSLDPSSFRRLGIRPLGAMLEDIWAMLYGLLQDERRADEWQALREEVEAGGGAVGDRYHARVSCSWGPFAFLIRDVAVQRNGRWHDYLKGPEIVEDICWCVSRSWGIDLFGRFHRASTPCLVRFHGPGNSGALAAALEYLVCFGHEIDLTLDCGYCFDGANETVPAAAVEDVEILSE